MIEAPDELDERRRSLMSELSRAEAAQREASDKLQAAETKQAQADKLATAEKDLDTAMAGFHDTFTAAFGAEPQGWSAFTTALTAYRSGVDDQLNPAAMQDNRDLWASIRNGGVADLGASMVQDLAAIGDEVHTSLAAVAAHADRQARTSLVATVIVIVVGILAMLAFGLVIATSIRHSVAQVKRSVEAIAHGDLTVVPAVRASDELGAMAGGLVVALDALRDLVGGVIQSAKTVAASSEVAVYTDQDTQIESGMTYAYAVAAQDCTPALSVQSVSNAVTVP